MRAPVLVVGDVMTDVVAVPAGRLDVDGDTEARIELRPGGAAANTACWLAALGVEVAFAGRVGADGQGAAAAAALREAGVAARLAADEHRPTGSCVVLVGPDGQRTMLSDAGANDGLTTADVPDDLLAAAAHLHVSGYLLVRPGPRPAVLDAVRRARAAGLSVSVALSSAAAIAAAGAEEVLGWIAGCDACFANEAEAAVVGAERLASACAEVVVTRGRHGASWCGDGGRPVTVLAAPVAEVVDGTGAGDAFAAGFLAARAAGDDAAAALAAGAHTASLVLGRVGARP